MERHRSPGASDASRHVGERRPGAVDLRRAHPVRCLPEHHPCAGPHRARRRAAAVGAAAICRRSRRCRSTRARPRSRRMFSDAIDITYIGPNPAINAFAQSNGEAIRIIAGATSGGAFLVVKPEINTAADLEGKKIATPQLGNTQDVALRAWLKEQGPGDRHRRRRRRLDRAPGERADARDVPGRHDRRRLGARAVGDPPDQRGRRQGPRRRARPVARGPVRDDPPHRRAPSSWRSTRTSSKRILLANVAGRRLRSTSDPAEAQADRQRRDRGDHRRKPIGRGAARRRPGPTSPSPSTRSPRRC